MEGFTEAERIAAAWSKLHALERSQNTNTTRQQDQRKKSEKRSRSRSKNAKRDYFDRDHDRDRRVRSNERQSSRKGEKYEQRDERDRREKPSYSPYRGNPDIRKSPTYSPYRGENREKSPIYIRKSRSRSPERRSSVAKNYRSKSRSRSRSPSQEDLSRLPPPPDPKRPEHDNRCQERRSFKKVERRYRSRSRSTERPTDPKTKSKWSHDRFTAADYDRCVPRFLLPPFADYLCLVVLKEIIFPEIIDPRVPLGSAVLVVWQLCDDPRNLLDHLFPSLPLSIISTSRIESHASFGTGQEILLFIYRGANHNGRLGRLRGSVG
jgi:hypothetical protein